MKHGEKFFLKEVKMHKLLVRASKSQGFEQSQKKIARSHNRKTVTFGDSALTQSRFTW